MSRPPMQPLDREERELAELLARLDRREGPPPELDQRILRAAREAVARPAPAPQARRRRPRWPALAGLAASVLFAAGIAWQLRPTDPAMSPYGDMTGSDAPTVTMEPAAVPAEAEAKEAAAEPKAQTEQAGQTEPLAASPRPDAAVTSPARVPAPPRKAPTPATSAPAAAPPAPAPVADAAMQTVAPPAPPAPPPPPPTFAPEPGLDAAEVSATAAKERALAEQQSAAQRKAAEREAVERAAVLRRHAPRPAAMPRAAAPAATSGIPPADSYGGLAAISVSEDARLAHGDWLQRIRERKQQGDLAGARRSLALFMEQYPHSDVPTDLRGLESQ